MEGVHRQSPTRPKSTHSNLTGLACCKPGLAEQDRRARRNTMALQSWQLVFWSCHAALERGPGTHSMSEDISTAPSGEDTTLASVMV